jgi:hypothetical protein
VNVGDGAGDEVLEGVLERVGTADLMFVRNNTNLAIAIPILADMAIGSKNK